MLRRAAPGAARRARLRAATHAVFGLLNSTPHSAAGLTAPAMRALLHAMASAALTLDAGAAG